MAAVRARSRAPSTSPPSARTPARCCALYRGLLALRRSEPDLLDGAYRTLEADGDVLRFARGDSIEVRIDFAAGDGAILKDGREVRVRTR